MGLLGGEWIASHNRHVVFCRIPRFLAFTLITSSLGAGPGCNGDSHGTGGGVATLWVAVDGAVDVYVDGGHVGEAEGWDAATPLDVDLKPGEHSLSMRIAADGDGAVSLWTQLPDGELLTTDGEWRAMSTAPPDCWNSGACGEQGSAVADLGPFGSWPWLWHPQQMEGAGACWVRAPAGEEWVGTQFVLGDHRVDSWSVSPTTITAGASTSLTLTFTAGSAGVQVGEVRKLFNTPLDGSWGRGMPFPRWADWQVGDPAAPDYLQVISAPAGVEVGVSVIQSPDDGAIPGPFVTGGRLEAKLAISGEAVDPGGEIVLAWGAGESRVTAPVQARRYYFPHTASEAEASMGYPGDTLGVSPFIDVVAGEATRVHLAFRGGSTVSATEEAVLRLIAVDDQGNPVESFTGTLEIGVGESQQTVVIGEAERGGATVGIAPGPAGLQRTFVTGDLEGNDTWLWVTEEPPSQRLYFGDIHGHTLASDGIWSAESSYRYADEVAGLDFVAVSDHAERLTETEWDTAVRMASALTRADFLALAAYEWTGLEAEHRCVYSLDGGDIPLARSGSFWYADPMEDVSDLWNLMGDTALIVPHHPGSRVGPEHLWADHDPQLEPVIEIYSKHGSSECFGCEPAIDEDWARAEGNFAQDALAAGLRFGFVASGDGHEVPLGGMELGHATVFGDGDYGPMVWSGGLTGVWAEELTREGLYEAIRARRCYATTGPRMFLQMTIDGFPLGSEIEGVGAPRVQAMVGGASTLRSVEIVRYTGSTGFTSPFTDDPEGVSLEIDWTDDEVAEDALYYLRVTQYDGHRAWSSPIWVDWE